MKTAYVASRFACKKTVKRIYSKLEKLGYFPSVDWTKHESTKPYSDNPGITMDYTSADIAGARKSDLFILISDRAGTGMHTELGAAIGHHIQFKNPLIYVIGKYVNSNPFFFHPSVRRRATIEDVIAELKE